MKLCLGLTLAILILGYAHETVGGESKNDEEIHSEEVKMTSKENQDDRNNKDIDELSVIDYVTRPGVNVDISLSRESFTEKCYVVPPNGEMIMTELLDIEGVTVQKMSDYVSCRITIGPMENKLLGKWKLCGESDKIRCQPVNLQWNSNANWDTNTRRNFTHPVNFGGSVHSGVADFGTLTTCHAVTPAGEDLVFTDDVSYPHMDASSSNEVLCSILFKDIKAEMLGDWIVYGIFRSFMGIQVIRLPLSFVLYNENDPYAQAYNVTTLTEGQHLVRKGAKHLQLDVSRRTATLDDCIFRTPSGKTIDKKTGYDSYTLDGVKFQYLAAQSQCVIDFLPVTKDAAGKWQITGKFSNGNQFDEIRQEFNIILEDPENPLEDPFDRIVEYLEENNIYTEMDTTHRIVINEASFTDNESCHLITPDGRQYAFINGFNVPGVEIINERFIECGVVLKLNDYSMIGQWTLIARATRLFSPIERRQPFTIHVERHVFIQDNLITVREGGDVYVHLNDSIAWPETCKLYGPDAEDWTSHVDVDELFPSTCGFIIRNVNNAHNGEWIIEHGPNVKYKGSVNITVLATQPISIDNLIWNVGEPLDITLGPNDTVYCKIEDNYGHTIYDDFGQCKIVLDRVTINHRGNWKIYIGLLGAVQLQKHVFYVEVHETGNKPVVSTAVVTKKTDVLLTCSVPAQHVGHACKFRDPHNNILVAAHGVGQGQYSFNGSFINSESKADTHDCTLRLTNPSEQDLGIWRCALDTSTGSYYGFLPVGPFAIQDLNIAASVITEPVLQAQSKEVAYMEDEPVVMSCFVPAPVRYCYFRARNGIIYNVFPGMPSSGNFGYIGSGLDAGECGIRFSRLPANESGSWSCHVGLVDSDTEQRATIGVSIRAQMEVRLVRQGKSAVVEAVVNYPYTIDYCRFVRINGQGFTMRDVPDHYNMFSTQTMCSLYINNPDVFDLHPWTVAVKVSGQDGEISATTGYLLQFESPSNIISKVLYWLLIATLCSFLVALVFIPEKNRKWTYSKASHMRNSFRRSWDSTFQKKPATIQATL